MKRKLKARSPQPPPLSHKNAVSTGSTLLNLAVADDPHVALRKGGYYFLVGDSSAGKTWLSFCIFAEACLNPAFDDYELIYDDPEEGAQMDIARYFGKRVQERVHRPEVAEDGERVCSDVVEDFYDSLYHRIERGKKFIYVLDSQDALDSEAAITKRKKQRKAAQEGKEAAGSYGDGKAKIHSENIRGVKRGLKETGSILVVIGQTRDNLGFGFEKKTRSGGKSLKFYSHIEIWTSVREKLTKVVRGKKRTIGTVCFAEVKKNRVSGKVGKDRAALIPIYYGMGVDDVGSLVDWLVEQQHWSKRKQSIVAPEFEFEGSRDKLIELIEEGNKERVLRTIAGEVWREIEDEVAPKRKMRYA